MTTSLTVNGVKCLNQRHFIDAAKLVGHPVVDDQTMNCFYDKESEIVTLKCYWCDYEAEVDVSIRPLQVKRFCGDYITIGPPIKKR
jgi:hypothetical protein